MEKFLYESFDVWYVSNGREMLVMFYCTDVFVDALLHIPIKHDLPGHIVLYLSLYISV